MKREIRHIPVLLQQVLDVIDPQPGQIVVDCTLGLGGHAAVLLQNISPGGRLIAIEFDAANIALSQPILERAGGQFDISHNNFAALPNVLRELGVDRVDAVFADLGVASPQIDDPSRGFSYRRPGPLDMRMNTARGQSAAALVNRMSQRELADAILEYGDETDANEIARLIVERRAQEPIVTTEALTAIICEARDFTLKRAAGAKLHPAARTFQALRILVNREMANLERLLAVLPECLKPGGMAAIISFHSGEDRRVKHAFKAGLDQGIYSQISPDVIVADEEEIAVNGRSRSAKMRWAQLIA